MSVGQKIKTRRIELNMSQDELAKKCGYKSRSSINKIETSRDLPLKKVKQMANALDLSVSYLMGWDESDSIESNISSNEINAANVILSVDESALIETYRNLDDESKRQLVLMLAFLKDQNNKK